MLLEHHPDTHSDARNLRRLVPMIFVNLYARSN